MLHALTGLSQLRAPSILSVAGRIPPRPRTAQPAASAGVPGLSLSSRLGIGAQGTPFALRRKPRSRGSSRLGRPYLCPRSRSASGSSVRPPSGLPGPRTAIFPRSTNLSAVLVFTPLPDRCQRPQLRRLLLPAICAAALLSTPLPRPRTRGDGALVRCWHCLTTPLSPARSTLLLTPLDHFFSYVAERVTPTPLLVLDEHPSPPVHAYIKFPSAVVVHRDLLAFHHGKEAIPSPFASRHVEQAAWPRRFILPCGGTNLWEA